MLILNFLEYYLTRKLTDAVVQKAAADGRAPADSGRVQQVPFLKWFFRGSLLLGLVLAAVALALHQPMASLLLFLLFGGLAIPPLISFHTCWIAYDETGFTVSGYFGTKRRYRYEDVTGLSESSTTVELEVNGKKRISLGETWLGRHDLARMIRRQSPVKLPKLPFSVLGMSQDDILASYQNGIFRKALVVPKEYRDRLKRVKWLHYSLCTLSLLLSVFSFLSSPVSNSAAFGLALLNGFLMLLVTALYFLFPQYFTAREKPGEGPLEKECRRSHKLCTMGPISLFSLFSGFSVLACPAMAQGPENVSLTPVWFSILGVALLFTALVALFRRLSWEYRTYRLGLVSFVVWQVMGCSSLCLVLSVFLVSP